MRPLKRLHDVNSTFAFAKQPETSIRSARGKRAARRPIHARHHPQPIPTDITHAKHVLDAHGRRTIVIDDANERQPARGVGDDGAIIRLPSRRPLGLEHRAATFHPTETLKYHAPRTASIVVSIITTIVVVVCACESNAKDARPAHALCPATADIIIITINPTFAQLIFTHEHHRGATITTMRTRARFHPTRPMHRPHPST
mmetsp:Transcript_6880/g.25042  ORF Transcript_6880/g.25042 Transcript_6880/m.25042 type:complete len:201 (+) Transcript_6880:1840-2442(+)